MCLYFTVQDIDLGSWGSLYWLYEAISNIQIQSLNRYGEFLCLSHKFTDIWLFTKQIESKL